jgi:hypothetical protein
LRRKLNSGHAIDVSGHPTYGGAYTEGGFKEGKDYGDAKLVHRPAEIGWHPSLPR